MAVCAHCGWESHTDDMFCQRCGMRLESEPTYAQSQEESVVSDHEAVNEESFALAASPSGQPVATSTATAVARLVVRSSSMRDTGVPGEEVEYVLDGSETTIGRSPSCEIPLSGDQLVSRRHALLRYKHGSYTIVDLGSSNGTYVNDVELRDEVTLRDGDIVKAGGYEMLYSTGPASPGASIANSRPAARELSAPLGATNPSIAALPALDEEAVAQPENGVLSGAHEAEEAEARATEKMPAVMETEPVPEVPAEPAAEASAPESDLDALRTQLTQISDTLTRRAEENARDAARMRSILGEVRDNLASILDASAEPAEVAGETSSTSELVLVARQAAENPRHLDYVTSLAAHASEIADALEARQMVPTTEWRAQLEALRARLESLLA